MVGEHTIECRADGPLTKSTLHINLLELQAVSNACQHFLPLIRHFTIRLMTDNITCMPYINRQGRASSHSLCSLVYPTQHQYISHIPPGHQNTTVDLLSRRFSQDLKWICTPYTIYSVTGNSQPSISSPHQRMPDVLNSAQEWARPQISGRRVPPHIGCLASSTAFLPFPFFSEYSTRFKGTNPKSSL